MGLGVFAGQERSRGEAGREEQEGMAGGNWRGLGRVRTIVAACKDEYGLRLWVRDERGKRWLEVPVSEVWYEDI